MYNSIVFGLKLIRINNTAIQSYVFHHNQLFSGGRFKKGGFFLSGTGEVRDTLRRYSYV
jgi:hypothetical protein